MNHEDFTLQSSLEANYLNVQLREPMRLDEIAIRVIKQDCPEFLIPFRIVNMNDSVSLKYKLINTIALEYSDMTLHKAEFIKLFQSLLIPFVKGKDWFLDYRNFCIDLRYVFLDKQTGGAYFIYIPEYSYQNTDEEIFDFFKNVFVRMTITDDANFQVRLFQYFSRRDVTLADLNQLIQDESRKTGGGGTGAFAAGFSQGAAFGNAQTGQNASFMPDGRTVQCGQGLWGTGQTKPAGSGAEPFAQEQGEQSVQKSAQQSAQRPVQTDKGKLGGGLFGGGKGKKEDSLRNELPDMAEAASAASADDTDEVMKALFGDSKKGKEKGKDKGKEKSKEKEKRKEKNVDKEAAKQEKKKTGGFGLFGRKKEQDMPETGQMSAGETISGSLGSNYVSAGGDSFSTASPVGGAPFFPVGDGGDKTEIISDNFQLSPYLELIDSPIPGAIPQIALDFAAAYITIGRMSADEVQPDVAFSRDFTRIGRQHARIENRGGSYFVIDLGSANHTLLNGQRLVPNQPYQLQNGGELTFTESKPVRYRIHL